VLENQNRIFVAGAKIAAGKARDWKGLNLISQAP
jgi:hypothetical protein